MGSEPSYVDHVGVTECLHSQRVPNSSNVHLLCKVAYVGWQPNANKIVDGAGSLTPYASHVTPTRQAFLSSSMNQSFARPHV